MNTPGNIYHKWLTVLLLSMALALLAYYLWTPVRRIQGVNLLQSRNIGFDQSATQASFRRLEEIGGNSVAFVPFIQQDRLDSLVLKISDAVTNAQLLGGIRSAREAGLRIILKPQLLISGSWAGAIDHAQPAAWSAWFDAYQKILLEYARLAQAEQVDILVIGTELKHAGQRPEWVDVIARVRQIYSGELSYCAHNLDGLERFTHWDLLDSASVSLYPSLGESGQHSEMASIIQHQAARLRDFTDDHRLPLWVAEIGIASRQGAFRAPWEWQSQENRGEPVDEHLQAQVLHLWLQALEGAWNRGVLVWAWYNDPHAGGPEDSGFSPQNKLAEKVLHCHWRWFCPYNRLLETL